MTDVVVPNLGESVTEATVAAWLKKAGEAVAVDEPLVELETDKATVEVGAPREGVLAEILVAEGETVAVGTVLAKLEAGTGAAPKPESGSAPKEIAAEPSPAAEAAAPSAPARPEPAPEHAGALDPSAVPRSGPDGSITAQDLRAFLGEEPGATGGEEPSVTGGEGPAARKLLAEHGLEASAVAGTGPGGRVTKEDVRRHVEGGGAAAPTQAPARAAAAASAAESGEERVRTPRIRQTIARRLKEAQETAAILTTFNEADMSAVMDLRRRYKERFEKKHGVRLGFTSFFAKAVVAAAEAVPAVNGRFEEKEMVYNRHVHIGMAVSAPSGLMVPVLRHCEAKSFAEIEAELVELAGKARDGKLREDDMVGGTFTISNGGVFGSLLSTPILNRPQSGILGLHKIQDRPMAVDGEVVVRPMMYLALSYDHRMIDGKEAVTFLVKVKECIEDPQSLMLDI